MESGLVPPQKVSILIIQAISRTELVQVPFPLFNSVLGGLYNKDRGEGDRLKSNTEFDTIPSESFFYIFHEALYV